MKRFFSIGVIICTLAVLCGCGGIRHRHSDASEAPDIYPAIAESYYINQDISKPPAEVFTTTASENGLDGTIYKVSGHVSNIAEHRSEDAFIWIFLDTDSGRAVVGNALNPLLTEAGDEVDQEKLASYFTLPNVGDYVCIYGEYIGRSDLFNCAAFIYGGTDYMTDAVFECMSDLVEEPEGQPGTSSAGVETGSDELAMTMGQKNALRSAKQYLSFSAYSYQGLIDQLEYEEYSTEDATFAADNCGADWNEQALKSAKDYLKFTAFSYSGLIEQLEYEGFTAEQTTYAADHCGADWNEQAAKSAESYLSFSAFSRNELIKQLEYEGFTHEQAVYGVEANGY